jgi:hypothetical protein
MVTGPTFFSANFDFGAQLSHENFKILHPHFSHVIYNLSKTLFCIKIDQQMAEISIFLLLLTLKPLFSTNFIIYRFFRNFILSPISR